MAIIGYPAGIGGTFWRAVCPPAAGRSTAVAGRCRGGHLGAPRMLGTQKSSLKYIEQRVSIKDIDTNYEKI